LWMFTLVIHCLVLFAIWLIDLPFLMRLVMSLCISLSLIYAYVQYATQPLLRLHRRQSGWHVIVEKLPVLVACRSFKKSGESVDFWCVGDSYRIVSWTYSSVFIVIVRIENKQGKQCYLPILSDCCQPNEFRWLRVVIKYLL